MDSNPKKRLKRSRKQNIALDRKISRRIQVLSLIIFACFAAVLIRLIYIQAFSSQEYAEKTEDYTSIRQYTSAPRGQIYDSKGRVLAQTVVSHNIVYTSPNNMTLDDYKLYAQRFCQVFDVNPDDFSYHDKQEAFITYKSFLDYDDPEYRALYLLSDEDQKAYRNGEWGDNAENIVYAKLINAIGDEQINSMSQSDLELCLIYQRMLAYQATGQENVILEDVSDNDIAYLVEHKTEFPGFDVDFGGWKRVYPYGDTLSDVLGSVSTTTEGLPEAYSEEYLAKGYQYNSSVGKNGLEYEYNDLLAGTPEVAKITYDSNGIAHKEVLQEAKKGYDIHLSIDIELQQAVDEIVKNVLQTYAGTERRENFSSLFLCMMDPNTGDIIAMSGYQMNLKDRTMTYFASGNYVNLINPGSAIKGATVYMGLSEGIISPNTMYTDEVLNIAGQEFSSFRNYGPVNASQALSVSSNVFMFRLAIALAGAEYESGQALDIPDLQGSFDKMRSYYSRFGLGNLTGLDVPDESIGYMGVVQEPGMLLNYAIGQFDMCTPIQMLQYVSTIASDGKLYQPHFYTYANEVNSEQVIDTFGTVLKSTLDEKNKDNLSVVQQGFRACVVEGNCGTPLQQMATPVSAKTGTAEVELKWTTANLVGYFPSADPEAAFACVAPTSSINSEDVKENICSIYVVPEVIKKYNEIVHGQ